MNVPGFDAHAFLESAPLVPIVLLPATGQVTFVGPQALEHLGYPAEDWLQPDFWARTIFPDDQSSVARARGAITNGRTHTMDYRMEHADGRVVWTSEVLSLTTGADGSSRLGGYLMEVTERKRQEVALWKSEERFRAILRRAPDAMVLTDPGGVILNMNDQAESLFDYRQAEIAGSSIDHLFPVRLRDRLGYLRAAFERDPRRRSLVDGHSLVIERRDGTEIPVELSMSLVGSGNDPHQILCAVRDLTGRRRVEAQLRTSERRLREMADVVPAMVSFVDRDCRFRFVNSSFASRFGWEPGHVEGRRVREVVGDAFHARLSAQLEVARSGTPPGFRERLDDQARGPDDQARGSTVDVRVIPQRDEAGDTTGYFIIMSDVSDQVAGAAAEERHRAELAHMGRVATMGELTASITHELSQPVTAMVTNARAARRVLCSDTPPDVQTALAALDDIAADGRRAGDVIASLRQLLRRDEPRREPVDIHDVLVGAAGLLHREAIDRGVAVEIDRSCSTLPPVQGDPVQLQQLLLNLLLNAIEATASQAPREGGVQALVSLEGSEIEVVVRDDGPGLPGDPEDLFQPFISHRPAGLGMGLPISRRIAEAHGGRLWAESSPDGAVFRVRLPT